VSPPRRAKAAPAVRKLALENGVSLDRVDGTGPGGRVTREDVLAAVAAAPAPPAAATPTYVAGERIPLRGLRRQIARNMVESWTRIPQAVDFREIDATALVEARRVAAAFAPDGTPLTYLALMVAIAAAALREHPMFNARLDEDAEEIVVAGAVNIGVATATPDGVIVPVVRDADTKSVYQLAREIDDLTGRARRRAVTSEELGGGTFTVNNTGALGPSGGAFPTPLINWPEAAILAFGRITDRVAAVNGEAVVCPTLMLTVTADHRLVDGADLVAFTNSITDMIERPDRRLGALGA
jgi:pyruvate dehydrogenase E2 component (dihydrolipoamide acetyltransferase)